VTPELHDLHDLRDLYQEVILDHGKRPRRFYRMEDSDRRAEGFNPLCGDKVTIYVKLDGDVLTDVSFQGSGCAISTASASLLAESLKGKTKAEAGRIFEAFHDMVTGNNAGGASGKGGDKPDLGKLEVFAGVKQYPTRVKCATLSWHTLRAALEGGRDSVSTE
jgi:nitrogen fixation NifU-like protein